MITDLDSHLRLSQRTLGVIRKWKSYVFKTKIPTGICCVENKVYCRWFQYYNTACSLFTTPYGRDTGLRGNPSNPYRCNDCRKISPVVWRRSRKEK